MTEAEALAALADMFGGGLGAAGAEVVIEEFMEGEEASLFVLCDGTDVLPVGSAQDHKRAGEGDTGPNTGGMGAYSPAPVLTDAVLAQAMEEIVKPTVAEMARRGTPFQGVLYAGLMIRDGRARLVEYNVRFGDPEAQALMMRLGAQAFDLIQACAEGRLAGQRVNWADDHALMQVVSPGPSGGPTEWVMIDVRNGSEVAGQRWHEGWTFDNGCCDDLVTFTSIDGGLVLHADDHTGRVVVSVYYPLGVSVTPHSVDVP